MPTTFLDNNHGISGGLSLSVIYLQSIKGRERVWWCLNHTLVKRSPAHHWVQNVEAPLNQHLIHNLCPLILVNLTGLVSEAHDQRGCAAFLSVQVTDSALQSGWVFMIYTLTNKFQCEHSSQVCILIWNRPAVAGINKMEVQPRCSWCYQIIKDKWAIIDEMQYWVNIT